MFDADFVGNGDTKNLIPVCSEHCRDAILVKFPRRKVVSPDNPIYVDPEAAIKAASKAKAKQPKAKEVSK